MKKLLLHICCGPCSTTVVERLAEAYDITGFFYNPNLYPEDEYYRRLEAARASLKRFGVTFVEGPYEPDVFRQAVDGYEHEPENGARCPVCYRLRLTKTAEYAAENGFDIMASTLTLGTQKKAVVINPVGHEVAVKAGILFLDGDWKKKDGFRRSIELSREFDLYRQHYCGCEFSMRD
ncbi:epoxyqueuosine reductase QueH [Candidatus Latescibacterota bacterium]